VPVSVQTTTSGGTISSTPRLDFLPVTREKAEHELTRQALEPAEVLCDMDDVELVRVGDGDALDCTVTDVHDQEHSYDGEVAANGGVFFAES